MLLSQRDTDTIWRPRSASQFLHTPAWSYAVICGATGAILIGVALQPWRPFDHLMRDSMLVAAQAERVSPWYGIVSNIGVTVWFAAAGAALLGAALVWRANRRSAHLLAAGAALSAWLGADDLLMLHESWPLGGGEWVVFSIHAAALLTYLVAFRAEWTAGAPVGLLLLALGLFALSLLLDLVVPTPPSGSWLWLVEDGAKLGGIFSWGLFLLLGAHRAVTSVLAIRVPFQAGSKP